MQISKIAWTESTWSPWLGCTKVSAGCKHCYAEGNMAVLMRQGGRVGWGPGQPRVRTKRWDVPLALERKAVREGRLIPVFPSLCDVFDNDPAQASQLGEWRLELFALIEQTPHLVWLLLTKRPEVAAESRWSQRLSSLGSNVWIGVSAEDQDAADRRLPLLFTLPAHNRFVSAEPLLGPLDLTPWLPKLDWVIVGGESGPRARPMEPAWAIRVREDCRSAGVPFFFKQQGGRTRDKGGDLLDGERSQAVPRFRCG